MGGNRPGKQADQRSPENVGDEIWVGDIQHSKAVAVGRGATAVYQGLSVEEVAALVVELKRIDQPKVWDGRTPYLGLTPFRESDAHFFFGRESLVDDLLSRLQQSNFIVIAGPSGSGKSSVVRAGLFHALRQGRLERSDTWLLAIMQPAGDPLEQLALAVARLARSPGAGDYLRQQGLENPQALPRQVETLLSDDPRQRCVLLVDQFEELFTQTKDEAARTAFINLLTAAAKSPASRIIIVLSLRSDFVSHCARFPELRALMSRQFQLVGAMAPPDLAKAITLPALEVGAAIDPALVSRIMADMKGEPGALPLMSFALRDLFETEKTRPGQPMDLTLPEYLHRGGIESALERHANQVFATFSDEQRALARSIFSRLIEVGQGRADTRRTATFQELVPAGAAYDEVSAVVSALTREGARLLTSSVEDEEALTADGKPGQATVTIVHEKLIDAWPWLRALVDENRELIALQNDVSRDAQAWQHAEKEPGFLYRGGRLLQLEEKLGALRPGLDALSQEFVEASLAQRQREIGEKEAQRRRTISILSGATIVALALAAVAFLFYELANRNLAESQHQESIAIARALADQAIAEASRDPQDRDQTLALLLAIESYTRTHTAEVHHVMRTMIEDHQPDIFALPGAANWARWNGDETYLLTGSTTGDDLFYGNLMVWARDEYEEPLAILPDSAHLAAWNAVGDRFVTWSWDGPVSVWDVATLHTGEPRLTLPETASWAIWTADGSRILTRHPDRWRVWDGLSTTSQPPLYSFDPKFGVEWSQDDAYLPLFLEDGTVTKLDAASLEPVWTLPGVAENAEWNPAASRVWVKREANRYELWDATVALAEPLATLPPSYSPVTDGWSRDGTRHLFEKWSDEVYGASNIMLLDAISGKEIRTLDTSVLWAVWEEEDTHIVTLRESGVVDLWDGYTGLAAASLFPGTENDKRVWYWNDTERRRMDAIEPMVHGLNDAEFSFMSLSDLPEQIVASSRPIVWMGWSNDRSRSNIVTWDGSTATVWAEDGTQALLEFQDVRGVGVNGKIPAIQSYDNDRQFWVASESSVSLYPASPLQWLQLACQSVEQNLSWEAWREAFPGERYYHRTCTNLPVHPSVVDAVLLERSPEEIGPYLHQWERQDPVTVTSVRQGISARIDAAIMTFLRLEDLSRAIQLLNDYEQSFENGKVSAATLNALCWSGAVSRQANLVLPFCNRAAALEPTNGLYTAGRGLVRALTGDYSGAAADFRLYQHWLYSDGVGEGEPPFPPLCWICEDPHVVEQLEAGENPLGPEEMAWLRSDWIEYFYQESLLIYPQN